MKDKQEVYKVILEDIKKRNFAKYSIREREYINSLKDKTVLNSEAERNQALKITSIAHVVQQIILNKIMVEEKKEDQFILDYASKETNTLLSRLDQYIAFTDKESLNLVIE